MDRPVAEDHKIHDAQGLAETSPPNQATDSPSPAHSEHDVTLSTTVTSRKTAVPFSRKKTDSKTSIGTTASAMPSGQNKTDSKSYAATRVSSGQKKADSKASTATTVPSGQQKTDLKSSTVTGRKKTDSKAPTGSAVPSGQNKTDSKVFTGTAATTVPSGRKKADSKATAATTVPSGQPETELKSPIGTAAIAVLSGRRKSDLKVSTGTTATAVRYGQNKTNSKPSAANRRKSDLKVSTGTAATAVRYGQNKTNSKPSAATAVPSGQKKTDSKISIGTVATAVPSGQKKTNSKTSTATASSSVSYGQNKTDSKSYAATGVCSGRKKTDSKSSNRTAATAVHSGRQRDDSKLSIVTAATTDSKSSGATTDTQSCIITAATTESESPIGIAATAVPSDQRKTDSKSSIVTAATTVPSSDQNKTGTSAITDSKASLSFAAASAVPYSGQKKKAATQSVSTGSRSRIGNTAQNIQARKQNVVTPAGNFTLTRGRNTMEKHRQAHATTSRIPMPSPAPHRPTRTPIPSPPLNRPQIPKRSPKDRAVKGLPSIIESVLPLTDDSRLGSDDHFTVLTEVNDIRCRWKQFGAALNIRQATLKTIEITHSQEPEKCLAHVLTEFLGMNYDRVEELGPPSWRKIVIALGHEVGGNNKEMALEVAEAHPVTKRQLSLTRVSSQEPHPFPHYRGSVESPLTTLQQKDSTSSDTKEILKHFPRQLSVTEASSQDPCPSPHYHGSVESPPTTLRQKDSASSDTREILKHFPMYDQVEVEKNIVYLEEKFEELQKETMKSLEVKGTPIAEVIHMLTALPASEKSEHKLFFDKNLLDLWQYAKFEMYSPLFSRLNTYWNYLSPQLLYHLMRKFTIGMRELDSYDIELFYFRSFTLLSLFCQIDSEYIRPPEGFSKVVVKFEERAVSGDPTLQHVEKFRKKYASHYRLRDFALMLVARGEIGSFIITFMLPSSLFESLNEDIPTEILKEFGITHLAIDGSCVYESQLLHSAVTVAHLSSPTATDDSPSTMETTPVNIPFSAPRAIPVSEGIKSLQKKFNSLRQAVRQSMVMQRVTTAQFSALVTCLSADKANNYPAFLKQLGALLFNVVHHYESLGAMIYYWHYLSYHMLDYLSESLNLEDVQEQFQEYKDEVHIFQRQTTLVEICQTETIKRVCPPCYTEIVTQFLWPDTAILERLEDFRNDYLKHYDLHSYSMILGFVELVEPSHTFRVTWFVPGIISDSLIGAVPESLNEQYTTTGKVRYSEHIVSSSLQIDGETQSLLDNLIRDDTKDIADITKSIELTALDQFEAITTNFERFTNSKEGVEDLSEKSAVVSNSQDAQVIFEQTPVAEEESTLAIPSEMPYHEGDFQADFDMPEEMVMEEMATTDESVLATPGVVEAIVLDKKDEDENGTPEDSLHSEEEETDYTTGGAEPLLDEDMQSEEKYKFVNPSVEYECPILHVLLLEPHLTECCGKRFSEKTVTQLLIRNQPCPLCKKPLNTMKDQAFRQQIRELPVYCSNRSKGCRWVAELSSLEKHLEDCPYKFGTPSSPKQGHKMVLTEDDALIIVNELTSVCHLSYQLGKALQLSQQLLDDLAKKRPKAQLIQVIEGFQERKNPPPTWNALIEALNSIKCPKMAKKLKETYLKPKETEEHFILPDNSVTQFTKTVFGHGPYGHVIEVAYRGSRIYAAKKYRLLDKTTLLRVFGEENMLCKIRHANLVPYFGVGALASDHSPVVVMARMNMNLATFLKEKVLSLHQKIRIIHEMAQGLNHLHSLKPPIIHGDLTENNVLFSEQEVARIADYGNGLTGTPQLTSTTQGATYEYMPPEVLEGGLYNEMVDIFSLGHLIIYIINQDRPHPLLRPNFRREGVLIARSEVERRAEYLEEMKCKLDGGEEHPLFKIATESLSDEAESRLSCKTILQSEIFKAFVPEGEQIHTLEPDTIVYKTGVVLGRGTYGDVIEVQFQQMTYAAKIFCSENKFSQEHKILAQIRHPNIVPYHGICKLAPENTPVLVMEQMEMDLEAYLKRNSNLPLVRKLEILRDIVLGLNHMHTHTPTIIHRDLTARNVLLTAEGTAKIGDFGNSQVVQLNMVLQDVPYAIPGTLPYMPPEAYEDMEHDDKFDIFSLGHLGIYIIIQHEPHPLLPHTYTTTEGEHCARTEVERRQKYLEKVKIHLHGGETHPLYTMLVRSLSDEPEGRPSCASILESNALSVNEEPSVEE